MRLLVPSLFAGGKLTVARLAVAASVSVHIVGVAALARRGAAEAMQPAPVDERPEMVFLIADTQPEAPTERPEVAALPRTAPAREKKSERRGGSVPPLSAAPQTPSSTPTRADLVAASTGARATSTPALEVQPGVAPLASGELHGATAASPATPPSAPAPSGDGSDLDLAGYGRSVHARIVANVRFPERAARERIEGTVVVELALDGAGRLLRATVVGDAHEVLRAAALEAVTQAAPFPAPPGNGTRQIAFQVPLRFFLRR